MKLFTKYFLDNLQKRYKEIGKEHSLDALMYVDGLSFHDAVVLMAEWEKITPEYIGSD